MAKPKLFIASSWVAVRDKIVDTFTDVLQKDATCVCWEDEAEFKRGSTSTLEALMAAANRYDYAIFLLTPDDKLTRYGEKKSYRCPRDNVIFELGLFLSVLGPNRVYAYQQKSSDPFWVLSDWKGIQAERFDFPEDRDERRSNIKELTKGLRENIQDNGFRTMFLNIAKRWTADVEEQCFRVRLDPLRIRNANISDYRVCVAARVFNEEVTFEEDETLLRSEARNIRSDIQDDLVIACSGFEGEIKKSNCTVDGAIVLLPKGVDPKDFKSLDGAESLGCKIVQKPTFTH